MEDAQETLRSVVIPKEGRDEFNLAEFPITLLTDRVPAGLKTLEYSDEITDKLTGLPVKRKVIITGSDAWGLPTAAVADVLVGMVHLMKQGNGFTSRVVP